jgi:hypothetical protein
VGRLRADQRRRHRARAARRRGGLRRRKPRRARAAVAGASVSLARVRRRLAAAGPVAALCHAPCCRCRPCNHPCNHQAPGSCGRCYEVKCAPGPVLGWEDKVCALCLARAAPAPLAVVRLSDALDAVARDGQGLHTVTRDGVGAPLRRTTARGAVLSPPHKHMHIRLHMHMHVRLHMHIRLHMHMPPPPPTPSRHTRPPKHNHKQPVDFTAAYFPFWQHANASDEQGRSFPGVRFACACVCEGRRWCGACVCACVCTDTHMCTRVPHFEHTPCATRART